MVGFLLLSVVAVGCGSDDGGGGGGGAEAVDGAGGCPSTVFVGEVSREADPQQAEHRPVTLSGDDIESGLAVALGDRFTVYLATYELAEDEVGATLTAPPGEVLVTLNVPSTASTQPTDGYLTVDSGAGAISTGSTVEGGVAIEPIEVTDDAVCMTVLVEKDYELVDGTFRVPVAA